MEAQFKKYDTGRNGQALIEYQWFSYAMCYLKRAGSFKIKKEIFDNCKKNFGSIKTNEFIKRELNSTQKRYVRLFNTFYYHEDLAKLHDRVLFSLLGIYKKMRRIIRG